MLVFVTPKRSEEHKVPYSYRTRANIVSENIFDSRVTDDIKTLQQNDVAVLGKRHTREDAEYCLKHDIKYIVADWTNKNNEILKALENYNRNGVPLYIFWKPGFQTAEVLPAILTEQILLDTFEDDIINN